MNAVSILIRSSAVMVVSLSLHERAGAADSDDLFCMIIYHGLIWLLWVMSLQDVDIMA